MDEATGVLVAVFAACLFGLLAAAWLASWIMKKDEGSKLMKDVSDPIREGAQGFFRTQYGTISILSVVSALILFGLYFFRARSKGDPNISRVGLSVLVAVSFMLGSFFSGVAGFIGMWVSVRANVRVASAAQRSYNEAIQIALRGGAFAGFLVVALSVLGVGALYAVLRTVLAGQVDEKDVPILLVGYGFGASFVALFAQLGGGIYTKAADVGADLVGKVEQGIPEDDPRNPAVIADLVGDNVGDCAGRGADLFESIAAENIGAMILGATLATRANIPNAMSYILFPLLVHAVGLVASFVGMLRVKAKEPGYSDITASRRGFFYHVGYWLKTRLHMHSGPGYDTINGRDEGDTDLTFEDPMDVLKRGYAWTLVLATAGFLALCYFLLRTPVATEAWWHFALCGLLGVFTSWLFVLITQYYTDYKCGPVKRIALASESGHGTNIISGISVGLESTALPVLVISIAIVSAYNLGVHSGLVNADGVPVGGLYGTAMATMGMLSTTVYVLAMDTFGPIADNAGGIAEMSHQPPEVRRITDRLDAVGNTTKALTKGYAIGSASLAAFLLFSAYMEEVARYTDRAFGPVDISIPEVFVGGLLGAMVVFLFSAWSMRAVSISAQGVVREVRRQFQERPGILQGTEKPDYSTCVALVARDALREMIRPGLLVVLSPIIVGFAFRLVGNYTDRPLLGADVVVAFVMIGTIAGILMALFMNNGGGAWDNAKKYIEMGAHGGKNSDAHKAAVTGDTVGDPFKDTAGPSLHVLIKLLSTITLVLAPLFLPTMA
mmetsp:Transcript_4025/g.6187  ORF Transcript_4025/g.6187 Transcript_4025/m.6187 type:complete len:781 (-) Transcript_4025:50-2392(-)|eukprot:CAMPEP_0184667158 /NCGR_PEP_ID=MMETSP0308-20130426/65787_1 /TAXON_ID=38269 /ORGANISM="Gloeochaete witrockiana, Strain SAG 46.84" /LENGTH=780 /DNA_ID=CAMNT_0027112195 /DNA_START=164 /DNA_END=2506 /DNA_ORIENTATION=+